MALSVLSDGSQAEYTAWVANNQLFKHGLWCDCSAAWLAHMLRSKWPGFEPGVYLSLVHTCSDSLRRHCKRHRTRATRPYIATGLCSDKRQSDRGNSCVVSQMLWGGEVKAVAEEGRAYSLHRWQSTACMLPQWKLGHGSGTVRKGGQSLSA